MKRSMEETTTPTTATTNDGAAKIFQCETCKDIFPSRNKLFNHLSTHTMKEDEKKGDVSSEKEEVVLIFEDDECKVLRKPQGIPTMGSAKAGENLFKHPILLIPDRFVSGGKYRKAVPCHRLDSATGGLIICSKSKASAVLINQCFRKKLVSKRYVAIIPGTLKQPEGFILSEIDSKPACTYFKVCIVSKSQQYGEISTINLWPITGRKHQLRRQMKELGHPIIGDARFNFAFDLPRVKRFQRLFLWAIELRLPKISVLLEKYPTLILPELTSLTTERNENLEATTVGETLKEKSKAENVLGDDEEEEDGNDYTWHEFKVRAQQATIFNASNLFAADLFANDLFSMDEFYHSRLNLYGINLQQDLMNVVMEEPSYYEEFRITESG